MIDTELCESLCLSVNPFIHNISHYVGVEGASMSGSAITILGWVEVNLGISFMGNMTAKFWITECMYDRATPIVLGSHQIKRIFSQANLDKIDFWPKPWRAMYEWCSLSKWYGYECTDELYDYDGSTIPEMIHFANQKRSLVSSLSGSWSELMGLVDLECEEYLDEVEPQEKDKPQGKATNEKQGILDSGMESEGEACSTPSARAGPPPKKEEANPKGGDDSSVFNSLAQESENTAEEVSDPHM